MGNEVEIFDNGTRVEMFRIISAPEGVYTATGGTITYNCEHVLAYLMDDVLFQYHEIGGYGQQTPACIEYLLARQTVVRWQLGTCAFSRQFQYSFENETLMRALLSFPKQFDEEFIWTFDTTSRPWTLNLVAPESGVGCEMRYARNMTEIRKSVDSTELVTRLYALGYGEGVNQLTIKDVNGGVPYLDADTQAVWGIRESIWSDGRFEIAENLKARALAILEERKNPYISYKVKAIDLYPLTGEPFDQFKPGKLVRVNDQEHGILVSARVTEITKKDVRGAPGDITVTIANRTRTVADTIAELVNRTSINELYAQGSTCIYQTGFADNADTDHPATLSLEIPAECVRINKLRLKFTLLPFRSYSQGAQAGGGTTTTTSSGGGNTPTTSAGGGATVTSAGGGGSVQAVVDSGTYISGTSEVGSTNLNSSQTTGSAGDEDTGYAYYAGAIKNDTGSGGGHSHTIGSHTHSGPSHAHGLGGHTHYVSSHSHSFDDTYTLNWGHTHGIPDPGTSTDTAGVNSYSAKTISISGTTGSGGGAYSGGSSAATDLAGTGNTGGTSLTTSSEDAHTHSMQHYHAAPAHTHSVAAHVHAISALHFHTINHTHNVNIPDHTHSVSVNAHTHTVSIPAHSHDVTVDAHTHELTPGIYDGPVATSVAIQVDGEAVPPEAITDYELDLTPYLSKDEDGKIIRGTWHTITITPDAGTENENGLTRIEAAIFVMTFARSQGGGDY